MKPNIKISELPRIKALNREKSKIKLPQAAIITWFEKKEVEQFGYIPIELGEDFDSRHKDAVFMYALLIKKGA